MRMYSKWLLFYAISCQLLLSDCVLVTNKTKPCPTVRLARGRVKYLQKGKLARFLCNSGYLLAGERYSSCIKGAWDAKTPICVKPSCGKIKAPLNGLIYPQYQGAVLNFLCKAGYTLRGSLVSYCDGFTWTNNLPTCVATGSEPPMSCDFESVDLCGWQHDLNHNFDWRRYNFQTPSGHIGTGPRSDHTKGEGKDGYYMYIESSSRIENDTARLLSPVYSKMERGVCLTFFYHMFGSGIGSLRVYVKKQSQSYDTKYLTPEFVESGNQGDVWRRGVVSVASVDEPFQIIMEGVRGRSYVSDIAIDDVSLSAAECADYELFSTLSTTEESSTEMAPLVESCVNRCDNSSDTVYVDSFVLACDCVDACIENNSCCPDYVAVCILGSLSDFTDSYDTTTAADSEQRSEEATAAMEVTSTPSPATTTARAPAGTRAEASTRYTGRWWMDTTTSGSSNVAGVSAVPAAAWHSTTGRPRASNLTTAAVKPTASVPRRWYHATSVPGRSATSVRPLPTRTANTTSTNTASIMGNSTNPGAYVPRKPSTSTLKPAIDSRKTNSTNLRPYYPKKPSTSTVKPIIDTRKTNSTNLGPYYPRTTTLKPTTATTKSSATNLHPYFPGKPTETPLKPEIDRRFSTRPPKSQENKVIKPALPTPTAKPPPAVSTAALPGVPTERDDAVSATLQVETDYDDANSSQPVLFAKNEPIVEAKTKMAAPGTHVIIMGVLCGAVLVMLVALGGVLVARRRHWKLCRRYRGVRRSDSMSDVRFLASDEVLDFTWRSAHN